MGHGKHEWVGPLEELVVAVNPAVKPDDHIGHRTRHRVSTRFRILNNWASQILPFNELLQPLIALTLTIRMGRFNLVQGAFVFYVR